MLRALVTVTTGFMESLVSLESTRSWVSDLLTRSWVSDLLTRSWVSNLLMRSVVTMVLTGYEGYSGRGTVLGARGSGRGTVLRAGVTFERAVVKHVEVNFCFILLYSWNDNFLHSWNDNFLSSWNDNRFRWARVATRSLESTGRRTAMGAGRTTESALRTVVANKILLFVIYIFLIS